jgi:hypothetical protein
LTAIRMAEAQLAVPSGAALPANSSAPSWATGVKRAARYTPSNTHNFPRGTNSGGLMIFGLPPPKDDIEREAVQIFAKLIEEVTGKKVKFTRPPDRA